jgi:hypothetical protein
MTSRPTLPTIERLFALSGNRCAFPGCTFELFHEGAAVGEICHIKAQKLGGPRYDRQQSDEERHSFENLILLCGTHHTVIDGDETTYTVQRVTNMKRAHEVSATKMSDEDSFRGAMALLSVYQPAAIIANSFHANTINIHQRMAHDDILERAVLKLKCSFDMNDRGCVRPNTEITFIRPGNAVYPEGVSISILSLRLFTEHSIRATYFRLKVEIEAAAVVSKCRGRLLSIRRDGQNLLGEPLILPFAPSENPDSLSKEIHQGVPEYVDFLAITDGDNVMLTPPKHHRPSSIRYEDIFSRPGEYMLTLGVTSEAITTKCELRFNWTGERETSEITCV